MPHVSRCLTVSACFLLWLLLQVVEIAPAPNLAQDIKDALYADAVKLAKHVGYRNAGGCLRYGVTRAVRHACGHATSSGSPVSNLHLAVVGIQPGAGQQHQWMVLQFLCCVRL